MADWPKTKQSSQFESASFEEIVVDQDLRHCIEENLEACFSNVYEQLPVINFTKFTGNDEDRPENSTYIGKLEGHDENDG